MKIAIFGGTFNPLHIGHAMLAETLQKELGFERVLIIPTATPPHKIISNTITANTRLDMVKAFCKEHNTFCENSTFIAEDCEIIRGGISYTYDTVTAMLQKYGNILDGKLALVMGQETAAQFSKWLDASKIASLCDIIIARRHPDHSNIDTSAFENKSKGNYTNDFSEIENAARDIDKTFAYPHKMLENPLLPVSSTQIRSRIANGLAFRYLLPNAIYEYIINNHLYGYH